MVDEMKESKEKFGKAQSIFRRNGGVLRTNKAIKAGIHPRTLYEMREAGIIERLSRGVYRLTDLPEMGEPDLVSVAIRVPDGIICLISALAFHEITTQIPHEVYIAVERESRAPRIDYPPVRVFRFPGDAFTEGIEVHKIDNVAVRVYSPEKTVADCFKYRNKIGLDTAIEALKLYRESKRVKLDALLRFAAICRVKNIMRPYLEALM